MNHLGFPVRDLAIAPRFKAFLGKMNLARTGCGNVVNVQAWG